MSVPHTTTAAPRYDERLGVPPWWWLPALGLAALIAFEVDLGIGPTAGWVALAVLTLVAGASLIGLGRIRVRVVEGKSGHGDGAPDDAAHDGDSHDDDSNGDGAELWVGRAHVPLRDVARAAEVPRSAKSAALGRQLDPAAYVVHRAWVGPLVLVVLDDPDDPTPYWLVSTRRPDRLLAALRR